MAPASPPSATASYSEDSTVFTANPELLGRETTHLASKVVQVWPWTTRKRQVSCMRVHGTIGDPVR